MTHQRDFFREKNYADVLKTSIIINEIKLAWIIMLQIITRMAFNIPVEYHCNCIKIHFVALQILNGQLVKTSLMLNVC